MLLPPIIDYLSTAESIATIFTGRATVLHKTISHATIWKVIGATPTITFSTLRATKGVGLWGTIILTWRVIAIASAFFLMSKIRRSHIPHWLGLTEVNFVLVCCLCVSTRNQCSTNSNQESNFNKFHNVL